MERGRPRKRRKQRKRKHQRLKQSAAKAAGVNNKTLPATGEIWSSTYKRLLQWHQAQVHSFCRQQPNGGSSTSDEEDNFSAEEEEDEVKLQPDLNVELDGDDDDNDVDADYLEFLQVTLKHQAELRKLREAQQTTTTTEN